MATTTDDITTTTQEVSTASSNFKTDTSESTTAPEVVDEVATADAATVTEDVETEFEEEENEEEEDNIFVIRVDDKNYGWTHTLEVAKAVVQELVDDLVTQDTSNITFSVKKDNEIRIYSIYKFFILSYERLMHTVAIDEISRLAFTD